MFIDIVFTTYDDIYYLHFLAFHTHEIWFHLSKFIWRICGVSMELFILYHVLDNVLDVVVSCLEKSRVTRA